MISQSCPEVTATTEELRTVLGDRWSDPACGTFEDAVQDYERRLAEFLASPESREGDRPRNRQLRGRINRGNENEQHVGVSQLDLGVG